MGRTAASSPETTGTSRKQFMLLEGAPILVHTVRKFAASPTVTDIVVAVREEDMVWTDEMLQPEVRGLLGNLTVVEGGNTRQESVERAFATLGPAVYRTGDHSAGGGRSARDGRGHCGNRPG